MGLLKQMLEKKQEKHLVVLSQHVLPDEVCLLLQQKGIPSAFPFKTFQIALIEKYIKSNLHQKVEQMKLDKRGANCSFEQLGFSGSL